jgi:secreted PhoX family phosphatase
MRRGAMGAGAFWTLSLGEFAARRASAGTVHLAPGQSPYGPISPKLDDSTGLPLLMLPDGFKYKSFSWTGDMMSDGVRCPSLHDGMAVIAEVGDRDDDCDDDRFGFDHDHHDRRRKRRSKDLILVRNHEQANGTPYTTKSSITYLPDGAGGTTNVVFDPDRGEFEEVWSSLAGTIRNCAGGVSPWETWVTCEETEVAGHGWAFEVGVNTGDTTPLKDMGRFSHEALMIDPRSGYVYETEDSNDSGFYRFVPHKFGRLERGGKLYMLKVKNQPNLDLGLGYPLGSKWDVQWVRIDDPTAATTSVYEQGRLKGGARFRRLEGAWWGHKKGYFLSTDGGQVREGQVFEYDPREDTITLIYDSPNANELDNPDNMTVTPRGGLLLCEDAAGNNFLAGERLIGVTLHGNGFTFAQNNVNLTADQIARAGKSIAPGDYRQSEWAGACYSPDGKWLFVNIQTPGITFAITGPWGHGPL